MNMKLSLKLATGLVISYLFSIVSCLYSAPLIPVKVALDWYVNPNHAPILVAQQLGLFKKQGLKVELLTPTSESEPVKLVAMNRAQIAITYPSRLFFEKKKH